MEVPKVFESEYRFCLILWKYEPVKSMELARICREELGWSKATTYTVIKRLSQRGVIQNENTIVTSLVSKEMVQISEIDELVKNRFDDSIPSFLAAFTRSKKLSKKDIRQLKDMIDSYAEDMND